MLRGLSWGSWMPLRPPVQLFLALFAERFLAGAELRFRLWPAGTLFVLRLAGDGFVSRPAPRFGWAHEPLDATASVGRSVARIRFLTVQGSVKSCRGMNSFGQTGERSLATLDYGVFFLCCRRRFWQAGFARSNKKYRGSRSLGEEARSPLSFWRLLRCREWNGAGGDVPAIDFEDRGSALEFGGVEGGSQFAFFLR